ncbi:iron(III) transport system permease protein [Oceanospirillum multiglobuliferum]|uniref:Phosphonate ABC transporter permease n=1 Tax=Oceanospirillum multiglobuliferum TaxID=64969 RepID=A0A1T4NDG3_9GAMM|nr:putative 2-aminoethylphosphonate ABC transporter permease subunit [Oceanospirillum multiglobuliferum]OPX55930.1 phosphonate ABC transporter permease [Oceanospirillum multiglobuliferum]SJZ77329.1 iron(III) transport system permease protein [Oceanospirillum multiglobuliferum]
MILAAQPKATSARLSPQDLIQRLVIVLALVFLAVSLILPLGSMFIKSLQDRHGAFVGLDNFAQYFGNPVLFDSISNSLQVALISTLIVIVLAFLFAYGLTRTCMPGKKSLRALTLLPLFAPSLLPAISLIYLFGNQGVLKPVLMGGSIYGEIGIVMGMCFWVFPHVLMMLITALSNADARLYEAAKVMKASPLRTFFTVTLPNAKYGLISASFVAFTLVITDFGVPKVIGGDFNVLATDIYKQVVGQQNFQMGAVVSVILLLPALLSFAADRLVQKKQVSMQSARAVSFVPEANPLKDRLFFVFCCTVVLAILLITAMAIYAAFVSFWPYNMTLTFNHFDFEAVGASWEAYFNSLKLAAWTALIGTGVIFFNAYLVEKGRAFESVRNLLHLMAMIPMAVPGMVLGLSYIFFFNAADNPFHFIYATMAILVLNSVVHFYTVCHLTSITALKQLDAEFESVSASLKIPFYITFWRVTLPVSLPTVLEISVYLFVNAMTTVSAVVFLYSSDSMLASITVMNLDEAGNTAPAAAMAVLILATCLLIKGLHWLLSQKLLVVTQGWRSR